MGASGTKLLVGLVPGVLTLVPTAGYLGGWIPGGWRALPAAYAAVLVLMGVVVLLLAPAPDRTPGKGRSFAALMGPLRDARVWRFSLYYVIVFGAYVALSSWLPTYYKDTYHVSIRVAALLTATYIFPASLLRPVGGWLSDRFGPRVVTYAVFATMGASALALAVLSIPPGTHYGVEFRPGVALFASLMFVVGCGMGIGKASVFKYVPDYYPNDVGAVGGLVGAAGRAGWFPAAAGVRLRRASLAHGGAAIGVPRFAGPHARLPGMAPRRGAGDQGAGAGRAARAGRRDVGGAGLNPCNGPGAARRLRARIPGGPAPEGAGVLTVAAPAPNLSRGRGGDTRTLPHRTSRSRCHDDQDDVRTADGGRSRGVARDGPGHRGRGRRRGGDTEPRDLARRRPARDEPGR